MRKTYFIILFILCAIASGIYAQPGSEKEFKRVQVALQNDNAYKSFQVKLKNIMKTASGRNTNATAVKALFTSNKNLINDLKSKYKIASARSEPKYQASSYRHVTDNKLKSLKQALQVKTYTPPFLEKKIYSYGTCMVQTGETGSNPQIGKISYTTSVTDPQGCPSLGTAVYGFRQTIQVPSDPLIVGARIRFYYSFFHTGWDTYNGNLRVLLALQASTNFNSTQYNNLAHEPYGPYKDWKLPVDLSPFMHFDETKDFIDNADSSFVIEGYVTPGSTLEFKVGAGYGYQIGVGHYGGYHYSEFTLKKITVAYLKAGE